MLNFVTAHVSFGTNLRGQVGNNFSKTCRKRKAKTLLLDLCLFLVLGENILHCHQHSAPQRRSAVERWGGHTFRATVITLTANQLDIHCETWGKKDLESLMLANKLHFVVKSLVLFWPGEHGLMFSGGLGSLHGGPPSLLYPLFSLFPKQETIKVR